MSVLSDEEAKLASLGHGVLLVVDLLVDESMPEHIMPIVVTGPPVSPYQPFPTRKEVLGKSLKFVHCGQIITQDKDALSGCGTRMTPERLLATLSGIIVQWNKLYIVNSPKSKYSPKRGDIVIGRVTGIGKASWHLDTNHRLSAELRLQNTSIAGDEPRRKNLEDEIAMSDYLNVGDLICAEVQRIGVKGKLELQSRGGLKKFGQGILLKMWPNSVKASRKICQVLDITIVVGCNGFVWVSSEVSSSNYGENITSSTTIDKNQVVLRIVACIRILTKTGTRIDDKTLISLYHLSMSHEVKDLANPHISQALISATRCLKK
ncbi:unnamed protein product [Cylicocyclus nassatus]|uniref:RRP4 S1 domain-containing protein n=1 Tax=Cylicocyclus nassatus TaxID=53992 RepID=A0AA36M899_CYLNA|nr:unnamed protein product [Cylicocyclus nassatus]